MKRLLVLGSAASVYLVAAWMVAPGFYDGITPQQPYNWVCEPPIAGANSGVAAASGHLVIKVIDGTSDANSAFTDDSQVILSFLPGAFQAAGKTQVTVDIKPVSPCPNPSDLHFATNVYLVTADAPLVQDTAAAIPCRPACIGMRYSNLVPAPSFIYRADDPNGPWKNIGGNEDQQLVVRANAGLLGYFAAGYPGNATTKSSGTSQLLPIAVAVLIIGVIVAGIPLAMVRRRRAAGEADEEDDEGERDDEETSTPRT